jgi:DNA polymerase III delta prime subunit
LEEISRKILLGAAASGRVPNAYLFVGADPEALLQEATSFAKALNCASCDLLILSGGGKSIKIDEIRQVSDFVRFGPAVSKWKVIVINGADRMTEEASNSFLKTLEEPLDNILFILTTVRESKVLKTIASRCQKLMFNSEKPASDESVEALTEKILKIDEMSIPQMMAASEELSVDPELEEKLNSVIYNYRDKVGPAGGKKILAVREIFNALRAVERKGNKRLALDAMFLSLKEMTSN